MQNVVLKNWQRSWGTALALLAMLAWCLPTLAMGCALSSMPPVVLLNCSGNSGTVPDDADMQQMPCCQKVPIPQSSSSNTQLVALSKDSHLQILSIAYPHPHAPLWALITPVRDDVDVTVAFPIDNFSHPPAVHAVSPLHGRAPPSLI
jgi:hypothetical protein